MANDNNNNHRLAVLIDADNAQPSVIQELLAEVSRYGTATIKRAYGDWTKSHLKGWKDVLHALAIQPMQQFSYTSGKNATDAALIIDAMDVLHDGKVDGFCLVSSDSDFTRLATRIREAGLTVFGFGEQKTPEAFQAACDKFIFTEILRNDVPPAAQEKEAEPGPSLPPLRPMILAALQAVARDDGWAILGPVGSHITKNNPSFDARNYGFAKLGELMRKQPYLEVKDAPVGDGSAHVHILVRSRPGQTGPAA
ncbi:NYN domain-containing protein [Comamonadaceae bacterium G21597-S1]|nr:NYN domain-containing protein [Comamonadaceae bacterium G21597-S1]